MTKKNTPTITLWLYAMLAVLGAVLLINQAQIIALNNGQTTGPQPRQLMVASDLSGVDVSGVQSTAQGLATVMNLEGASQQEVINSMIPTGTPEYAEAMGGVSFDDPQQSLAILAGAYRPLKAQIQQNNPEAYDRWLSLAAAPKGMTCEFCCGIKAQAITAEGRDMCGCQHHPALQTVALWLIQNTDYNDAEVLREVYRWKSLFFPQDMVSLGNRIAGGDESVTADLPGMVGGC